MNNNSNSSEEKKETAILKDVAIPKNNLRQKYAEKISKYRELELQIERQWGMSRTRTIPILISNTGIISKSLKSNLKEVENLYKVMQKVVLLGTAKKVSLYVTMDTRKNHGGEHRKTDYQDINREIQDQATKDEQPRTQEKKNTEHLKTQSP